MKNIQKFEKGLYLICSETGAGKSTVACQYMDKFPAEKIAVFFTDAQEFFGLAEYENGKIVIKKRTLKQYTEAHPAVSEVFDSGIISQHTLERLIAYEVQNKHREYLFFDSISWINSAKMRYQKPHANMKIYKKAVAQNYRTEIVDFLTAMAKKYRVTVFAECCLSNKTETHPNTQLSWQNVNIKKSTFQNLSGIVFVCQDGADKHIYSSLQTADLLK